MKAREEIYERRSESAQTVLSWIDVHLVASLDKVISKERAPDPSRDNEEPVNTVTITVDFPDKRQGSHTKERNDAETH